MSSLKLLVFGAIVSAASIPASYAGPCSDEIGNMMARINAKLEAKAAAGPTAREGVGAGMSVQPTPRSMAAAEERSVRCRLKRLTLSGKPCRARVPPTARVTKTGASKHSRTPNAR